MKLQLNRLWELGDAIGEGGFGRVFAATGPDGMRAVAKLVSKAPGAQRELLFADLTGVRNVVPILDSGETTDSWVLIMPRAEMSLRDMIESHDGSMTVNEALGILKDLATALTDLEGRAVHRDIKPENVLRLDGIWCLADFGISRYAEATTAPDTRKFALSPVYAAPERWRGERASIAVDVYSVGIIAFELLSGRVPFGGRDTETLREQHLHSSPETLTGVTPTLGALIEECLFKAPGARPTPKNLLARLERASEPPPLRGLQKLQEANRSEVSRRAELSRRASEAQSQAATWQDLASAGKSSFTRIGDALLEALTAAAPSAVVSGGSGTRWCAAANLAKLQLAEPAVTPASPWGSGAPPDFQVVLSSSLSLRIPGGRQQYEGRSHSLWYCDAHQKGQFMWLETAFMFNPFIPKRGRQNPFALAPGVESAKAYSKAVTEFQVAWSWTPLIVGELDEFIDRWAGWFAAAMAGTLQHPRSMPER